jgi:hypothetical protein
MLRGFASRRGCALTWPARLRSGGFTDYYARGLRRTLGAPPSPGRHDSALGMTTTPGGYASRWELRPHPVSTNDRRANTKSLGAKLSAIGHTFTHPSCRVRSVSLANRRTGTVKARGEDRTLPGPTTRNSATPEGSKSPGNRQALAMPFPAKLGVRYTIGPAGGR